jgi:hypothetical protein
MVAFACHRAVWRVLQWLAGFMVSILMLDVVKSSLVRPSMASRPQLQYAG